jgi:predicted outer membrane repeat protein
MTAITTVVSNNDARYRGGALYVNDIRGSVVL